jgi:hypothetical protein
MSTSSATDDDDWFDELAEEFAERYRRGERPSLEEYIARLPEMADEIREMLLCAQPSRHGPAFHSMRARESWVANPLRIPHIGFLHGKGRNHDNIGFSQRADAGP